MSLFRVVFVPPGALTAPRTVHGANGHCGKRRKRRDLCPEAQGFITEVWLDAANAQEAQALAGTIYKDATIEAVYAGLSPEQASEEFAHRKARSCA